MLHKIKKELLIIILFLTALIFGSGYILFIFEKGVNNEIETYWNALWLAAMTASTTGYGDLHPVTAGGKFVASFLSFAGLMLVGVTSALATTYLLKHR